MRLAVAISIALSMLASGGVAQAAVALVDSIPPTLLSARAVYDPDDPEETAVLEFVFSEPVEWFGAILYSNYIDVNTGLVADQGAWFPPDRTQITFPSHQWGFGTCEQVRVINVKDSAGNTIVDDGIGNVFTFHLEQVLLKGRMSEHMLAHDAPPHAFAIEGDKSPLTWALNCDLPLDDADGDSTWTRSVFFDVPCTTATGGAETAEVAWRFSHQCNELEPLAFDRSYTIDLPAHPDGRDTLDVWWNDDAPASFTSQDVDVIFRVLAGQLDPPFGAGDSLGVVGSESPLSWDDPPLCRLLDDGVDPDQVAGDGVFSVRRTFPAGTFQDLLFRFVHQASGASTFGGECVGLPHRALFLDDTVYSSGSPMVLDLVFDDCLQATGVATRPDTGQPPLLSAVRPNPMRSDAAVAFSLPARAHATLTVLDVRGRVVRRLVDGVIPAGEHRVVWDGRTDRGRRAAAGVYFLRGRVGERVESRRVVLSR